MIGSPTTSGRREHWREPVLRYGRIDYVNVMPVEAAFEAGAVSRDVQVVAGVPSRLNALLESAELDVAAISAAHYLDRRDAYERIGDLCIAADGPVRSVVLVSPVLPALLGGRSVAVTAHSASARSLLEVILSTKPGAPPSYEVVDDALAAARCGRPALVIGDDALAARDELARETVYDLGETWRRWTGLPMVFAVWAVRTEVLAAKPDEVAALGKALSAARAWGAAHRSAVIDAAIARRPARRATYDDYFRRLSYTLDARAREGLVQFERLRLTVERGRDEAGVEKEAYGVVG